MTAYDYLKENNFNDKSLREQIEMSFKVLDDYQDLGFRYRKDDFPNFVTIIVKMQTISDVTVEKILAILRDEKLNKIIK